MRIQMQLGRDAMIAISELKVLLYGDEDIPVTQGYLFSKAYEKIKDKRIRWQDIANADVPNVTNNSISEIQGVKTTLNLEKDLVEGITQLQKLFREEFSATRIHKAFVVKLVLFAAILDCHGKLDKYEIKEA